MVMCYTANSPHCVLLSSHWQLNDRWSLHCNSAYCRGQREWENLLKTTLLFIKNEKSPQWCFLSKAFWIKREILGENFITKLARKGLQWGFGFEKTGEEGWDGVINAMLWRLQRDNFCDTHPWVVIHSQDRISYTLMAFSTFHHSAKGRQGKKIKMGI